MSILGESSAFQKLSRIEPALAELEADIRRLDIHESDDFWRLWESIKVSISQVAGWEARRPELRTAAAYECVSNHLFGVYERRYAEAKR